MAGRTRDLEDMVIALVGGSGFFGRHLAQELLTRGARLRICSRFPEKAYTVRPLGTLGQVQFGRVDVLKPETLVPAFAGVDAVVNLVGAFAGDLDGRQGRGAGRIAAKAREAGVRAFVHVSALGADASSPVAYARTKAEGESAVREAFPGAIILRPSVLFGEDDKFVNLFAGLVSMLPVLPVFAPHAKLQPLFVDDAAEAVAHAIAASSRHAGQTYELAGPEAISMIELHRRIARAQGRSPTLIELPDAVSGAFASLTGWLPGAPLTRDQWALLKPGNVATGLVPGIEALDVKPRPLDLFLDRWMVRYRKAGRFSQAAA